MHTLGPSVRDAIHPPASPPPLHRLTGALLLSLATMVLACSGHGGSQDPPQPIAECVQYQAALSKCLGHTYSLPVAAPPVGKSDAEQERTRTLCATNLKRIAAACR